MINPQDIPLFVRRVGDELEKAGFEAYLVGGCVRDLLLGKKPKDWDFTTNAHPDQIQAIFPDSFCNNDYGTVGVKNSDEEAEASLQVVEVTPYRSEGEYSDKRRPDSVTFGVSLEEDLARRDFTVNAIAYRIKDQKTVDLYDGVEDLKAKRLKAVGDPDKRFSEDALRMMRAVRLAAELDFVIEGETLAGVTKNAALLKEIAIERITTEFVRIIDSNNPMQGIVFLEKLNLLEYIIPELREGIGCEQGGIHAYDVFEHLLRTMQAAADKGYSTTMRIAALLHDVGKPATRRTGGKNKMYTFFGHEVVGARMTRKILDRLKYPREESQIIEKLVRWHMFFADPDQITLSAVRRTIVRIGEDQIQNLLNLRVCDRIGTGRPKEQPFRFRKYKAMVDEALRDPISVKMLKINGNRIMEITAEKPGKKLGYVLHALLEEVLNDPSKNTGEYLETKVLELYKLPEEELKALADAGKEKQAEEEAEALKEIAREHKVG
ncbi:MAG: HD domain-containing protein [Candidatus Nomurabacteria bacterium]|nr:HD domain-containing protein [Candidatus Nomurabacteria bacterium]USN87432.1 MAG: HD domain-containing protein [Candidatus Nomurabacteria bacterium]